MALVHARQKRKASSREAVYRGKVKKAIAKYGKPKPRKR